MDTEKRKSGGRFPSRTARDGECPSLKSEGVSPSTRREALPVETEGRGGERAGVKSRCGDGGSERKKRPAWLTP